MEFEPLPALSEAQTEIMNVVWDLNEVTMNQVWSVLSKSREIARNTVQTQLMRLEEKGWLIHRAEGKTFFYSATVPREAARSQVVQRIVDAVFGGSAEGLVMSLLDGRSLSRAEADRIRDMLKRAEEDKL